jgi:hypothetical protein
MHWYPVAYPAADASRSWIKQLVGGIGLLALGGAYLLGYYGLITPLSMVDLLPGLMAVIGLANLLSAGTLRRVIKGLFYLALALWLYACLAHWHGLHAGNAWPLLLILIGVNVLLKGFIRKQRR